MSYRAIGATIKDIDRAFPRKLAPRRRLDQ
jgi:hypothetical protein